MDASVLPTASRAISDSANRPAVAQEVEARLRRSGYLALCDVTCVARDGVFHLQGCLPTYYLKQVAQSVASAVEGVHRVSNEIEVLAPTGGTAVKRLRSDSSRRI